MNSRERGVRVGIIGTGYISRGLSYVLRDDDSLEASIILTRRNPEQVNDLAVEQRQVTNSTQELIDNSDIVIECSGAPVYATEVLSQVMEAGIQIVTVDSELQVTTGTWLAKKGLITEAEGDQPGSIAALLRDVLAMGFEPLVLGNIKRFLNRTPTEEQMRYWATHNGISVEQVTSFTDGTKLQIEQALAANGLNADIIQKGLLGLECADYRDGATQLARQADSLGVRVSDYVLSPQSPAGVFIAAKHEREQAPFLRYYKLGDGPYYVLTKPFHLCHLEVSKTIRQVLRGEGILLNNGENPQLSVATLAKRRLVPGETIKRGMGSFSVRGEAVRISDYPEHVPIGLVFDVVVKRYVDPGEVITFDDIDIRESQALVAWQETVKAK